MNHPFKSLHQLLIKSNSFFWEVYLDIYRGSLWSSRGARSGSLQVQVHALHLCFGVVCGRVGGLSSIVLWHQDSSPSGSVCIWCVCAFLGEPGGSVMGPLPAVGTGLGCAGFWVCCLSSHLTLAPCEGDLTGVPMPIQPKVPLLRGSALQHGGPDPRLLAVGGLRGILVTLKAHLATWAHTLRHQGHTLTHTCTGLRCHCAVAAVVFVFSLIMSNLFCFVSLPRPTLYSSLFFPYTLSTYSPFLLSGDPI